MLQQLILKLITDILYIDITNFVTASEYKIYAIKGPQNANICCLPAECFCGAIAFKCIILRLKNTP